MVGRAAFCARTFAAIGLALSCSFFFQLESPMSSVTTVMIVANPTVGALMAKSMWRIIGTLLGAAISIALMAVVAQSPVLYTMMLAVVVGFACLVATFLRLFRAYAAVLTGYTIVIVAAPSYADPDGIFLSAMARLSAVTVGIVATAVVFMASSVRQPDRIMAQVGQMVRDVIAHAMAFHRFQSGDGRLPEGSAAAGMPGGFRTLRLPPGDARGTLLARVAGLIASVEYAAADTYEIARRVNALRVGLSGLAGVVATYHPLWHDLDEDGAPMRRLHGRVAALMTELLELTGQPDWIGQPQPVLSAISGALAELEAAERAEPDDAVLLATDNIRDVLTQLDAVIRMLVAPALPRRVRLRWFLDWPTALRNGARGGLIALLAGLLWYVLHWSAGPMVMLYVVAASSLVATTPSASRSSVLMAAGTALSVPAGIACHMLVLPRIDGFPLLWFFLCAFLAPGVWLQFSPRYGIGAFGYGVFLAAILDVSNPIRYDDIGLTNTWMAFLVASALLVLGFRVVLPPDDRLDAARLVGSLSRAVRRLALVLPVAPENWIVWEGLQIQKIWRLAMRLSVGVGPAERQACTDAALGVVSLGRLVVRARRIAQLPALDAADAASMRAGLRGFDSLLLDPEATARGLVAAAREMLERGGAGGLQARQGAACLRQMAAILRAAPGFFHRHGPLQLAPDMPGARRPLTAPVPAYTPLLGRVRRREAR
ncbi:FUSC family protein [Gluconacetobacter sacchari]|uniref:FUSC family protein n=2 Tax=Gluconacetobacter sacchari TaxID=92759 RepID=A0A7W4IAI0_9PROT|nr:FUSC family protein [Gluconacetobacter sacchari]MBB2159301.1 FUSC family protein [Gluconacetobacter sacchari]